MKKLSRSRLIKTISTNRKANQLTQAQLADATGINRSMIGRIENGEYMPSIEQLEKLGEALNFEVADLFVEEGDEKKATAHVTAERKYNIAVAGTGYVGLSLATLLAQHNHVVAVDIVPEKVEMLNHRKSPIQDEYIEKYLAEK